MRPRVLLALVVGLLATGAVWWAVTRSPSSAPAGPSASARPTAAVPPAKASGGAPTLAVEQDKTQVFQRAFWRRPAAGDRILHAERREWIDATAGGVQKWQWFIAVVPSPEFRRWLIEDNPFELVLTGGEPPTLENPPAWFPAPAVLAGLTQYRSRGGHFAVFFDPQSGRIHATDAGSGFAPATR